MCEPPSRQANQAFRPLCRPQNEPNGLRDSLRSWRTFNLLVQRCTHLFWRLLIRDLSDSHSLSPLTPVLRAPFEPLPTLEEQTAKRAMCPPSPDTVTTITMCDALLEAVRGLRVAHPDLGAEQLLAKLREQQPDLRAGTREVREALTALTAESETKVASSLSAAAAPRARAAALGAGAVRTAAGARGNLAPAYGTPPRNRPATEPSPSCAATAMARSPADSGPWLQVGLTPLSGDSVVFTVDIRSCEPTDAMATSLAAALPAGDPPQCPQRMAWRAALHARSPYAPRTLTRSRSGPRRPSLEIQPRL